MAQKCKAHKSQRATYTTRYIKDMVLQQIEDELIKACYFAVVSDESKDKSKKEQVVVVAV